MRGAPVLRQRKAIFPCERERSGGEGGRERGRERKREEGGGGDEDREGETTSSLSRFPVLLFKNRPCLDLIDLFLK